MAVLIFALSGCGDDDGGSESSERGTASITGGREITEEMYAGVSAPHLGLPDCAEVLVDGAVLKDFGGCVDAGDWGDIRWWDCFDGRFFWIFIGPTVRAWGFDGEPWHRGEGDAALEDCLA